MSETNALATTIGDRLLARGWFVGTAESCTGGMVAAAITDIAGSSGWFEQGVVTYANSSKTKLLGVSESTLVEDGAVSEATVRAMISGVIESGADIAVATSGVAGPGGGSEEKPVGTVWFAWGTVDQQIVEKCLFDGDRAAVREQATEHALRGILKLLDSTV